MRTNFSLKTTLLCGGALIAFASTGSAQAQTSAPPAQTPPIEATPAAAQSPGEGDIVVTGSRVIRDGSKAPTPVTVITKQEIDNSSPTNNLADFVNQLPSVAGSIRPSNSRLELSNGIAGINALNLRNLGTVRTLVLIDGRRSVGSTVAAGPGS